MTILLMVSFVLAGLFGFKNLPVAAVPRVEVKRQRAGRPPQPGDDRQRRQLDERDERAAQPVEDRIHQRKQILPTQS